MKSSLITCIVMVGAMICAVIVTASPSYAQTNTDVTEVIFKDGSFKEAGNGMWREFDAANNVRYTFREVRRDANSVYLRQDALSVDLTIDLGRKMISGEWPGSPRRDLYRIVTHLLKPLTVAPPPTVTPPPVTPPPTRGPIVDTQVTGLNAAKIDYAGGSFQKNSAASWQEIASNGARFKFDQLGQDTDNIYMYDSSRRLFLLFDLPARKINQSVGGVISGLYNISSLSSSQVQATVEPEVTLRPGAMTPEQRRDCAAGGGTVERAGILGAERCTKRYNDGGMICTDSSQCQGRCLADTGDANKSNITGTCQKTDNPFGCYAEVKNGKSEFALCAD